MRNRQRKALQQRQLEESEAARNGSDRGTTQDHSDTQAGDIAGLRTGYMALRTSQSPRAGASVNPFADMVLQLQNMQGAVLGYSLGPPLNEETPEPVEIPTEVQLEPIRVWRALDIRVEGNNVALGAMNTSFGKFLAVEHEAECKDIGSLLSVQILNIYGRPTIQPRTHVAPELHCKCGFYGVKEKKDCLDGTIFIAEAEFYGKVIEHDTGYRAQFQRVLAVRVERPKLCLGAFLCDGEPEVLWFTDASQTTSAWGGNPPAPAVICQTCALEIASHGGRVATLPKLAARLGVEVRWDA